MNSTRKYVQRAPHARSWWIALALTAAPMAALAQTDEIQVYDGAIAERGKFNLMLHNNFTAKGLKEPAFPGAVESNHALVGVAEWAYGVTDWFEQGLYLPLYSFSPKEGASYNGFKLRWLFVRPHADDHTFFYGVNFEFSVNRPQWDPRHYTSEVRPIVGWHLKPIDVIFNPIMDTSYTGGFKSLDFAPSMRVAYNFSPKWAGAIEEYADYGELRQFYSGREQSHQIWAVANHSGKVIDIETGIGFGLTSSSDRVTLKFMISRDLN
ncbi:MAG TPA: hypothetical protein VL127_06710 [Bryobacteraceae bacterium]|jgi:hypothetical protein|nr:hypothetical protein [Bryobacteraceae bacterium]